MVFLKAKVIQAPFSFPGNGGSADATQNYAPASTNLPLDFAHSHFGANQKTLSSSHPPHSEADDVELQSPSDVANDEHPSSWTAQLCDYGHAEGTLCSKQRLPPGVLQTTMSAPSLVGFIEIIGLTFPEETQPLPNLNLRPGNFPIDFRFGKIQV